MLTRLRDRLGTAGFIIAVIALVAAMTGGAIAATGALTGKQKKEVKKIAKKYAGKPGAPGAAGPAGPAGPAGLAGPAGPAGPKGDTGNTGAAGSAGAPGKSVVVENAGAECEEGGTKFKVEGSLSSKFVCNGEKGPAGPEGPAGPTCPGGECVVPAGATQVGLWSFNGQGTPYAFFDISFPLRLPAGSSPLFYFVTQAEAGGATAIAEGCPGTYLEPQADSNLLCLYEGQGDLALNNAEPPFNEPSDRTIGQPFYSVLINPEEPAWGVGSWAVTPAAP